MKNYPLNLIHASHLSDFNDRSRRFKRGYRLPCTSSGFCEPSVSLITWEKVSLSTFSRGEEEKITKHAQTQTPGVTYGRGCAKCARVSNGNIHQWKLTLNTFYYFTFMPETTETHFPPTTLFLAFSKLSYY